MAADTIVDEPALPQQPQQSHLPANVEQLEEMWKAAHDVRRPNEGQWHLNIAFWRGHQWVMWDGTRLARLDDEDPLPVDNRIKPMVRKALAKETKQRPRPEATPPTADDDDIEAAQLAEELFDHLWDNLKLPIVTRAARWWRRMTGAGFLKVTWDRTKGDYVEVLADEQGKARFDETGRLLRTDREDVAQAMQAAQAAGMALPTKRICMGEINVQAPTTFSIVVDPHAGAEGLDTARWLIEEGIHPVEEMRELYPQHAHKLSADSHAANGSAITHLPGLGRKPEGKKTGVKTRELWQKPGADYPQGRHVIWADKLVLLDEDNPYGWLPYEMMRGDPNGGTFWPASPVTDLIPGQIRLNKRIAQVDDNADRFGNPALTYPEGMDLEYEGLPGEHLQFPATGMPDMRPDYLRPPELPGYVQSAIGDAIASMQEIAGQHEVSSAQVPAGVTAASAISMLLEQDDTQLGPDIEDADVALEGLCNKMLELAGTFYEEERAIAIAGEEGDWDLRRFRGMQLRGAGRRFRVTVTTGTPESKAMRQAAMMQLLDLVLKYGGPQALDPRNFRRFVRSFEVGGLERMFADLDAVERKAARENRRLLKAEPVMVNQWDRHAEEIAAHNEERMSRRFERATAENPEVAAAFDAHILAHGQALLVQMRAMQPADPAVAPPASPQIVPPVSLDLSGPPAGVPSP